MKSFTKLYLGQLWDKSDELVLRVEARHARNRLQVLTIAGPAIYH